MSAAHAADAVGCSIDHMRGTAHSPAPAIRRISSADIWQSLREGFADFQAYRSDVIFLCATYAIVGVVLARVAFGHDLFATVVSAGLGFRHHWPVVRGGPVRDEPPPRARGGGRLGQCLRRAQGPAIGGIAALGLILVAVFLAWLIAAWMIFEATLGPSAPIAPAAFLNAVLFTAPGQAMIVTGMGVGFLFALLAMMLSVASFPAAAGP